MSDYWKSLPRKFCDTCKCWFADNKASIEFHEKGKKHKENVQKRITQIQKKGLKEFKKKQKLENEMEKIERAALKAFKKDVAENPELAGQYERDVVDEPMPQFMPTEIKPKQSNSHAKNKSNKPAKNKSSKNSVAHKNKAKIWYEGLSDDGHKYYFNSVTSESQWDPPKEGYISIEEQTSSTEAISSETTEDPESVSSQNLQSFGPAPKIDPYGHWTTVENEPAEEVDLQLPEKSKDTVDVYIPITKDTVKMKEKTVGHLADYDGGECSFKKRKNLSAKRNVRQRLDDT